MSLIGKLHACNRWEPSEFVPWRLAGERIGWLRRAHLETLGAWPRILRLAEDGVHWQAPEDFAARSAQLADIVAALSAQGLIGPLQREPYPVTPDRRERARCTIDRAAAPFFGVRAFGQHLNGYVRTDSGLDLWVARRAADRRHYPNKLDNLVGGGLPHGVALAENLRKECREEAGMPEALSRQARPVGVVSYCRATREGLKPDVMYCYDLELPDDFQPVCTDGEVQSFHRWPVSEVSRRVRETEEFKLNCNLVVLDFLIRHGVLRPEDPDYLDLLWGLRAPLP